MQEKETPPEIEREINPYNEDDDIWPDPAPFIAEAENKITEADQ